MTLVFKKVLSHWNRFPEVDESECPEYLNTRQFDAVQAISARARQTDGACNSGPILILGPFGTGKTHTLAMAVQETLMQNKDARILICTHSNRCEIYLHSLPIC